MIDKYTEAARAFLNEEKKNANLEEMAHVQIFPHKTKPDHAVISVKHASSAPGSAPHTTEMHKSKVAGYVSKVKSHFGGSNAIKLSNHLSESIDELDEAVKKIGEYTSADGSTYARVHKLTGEHDEGDPYRVRLYKNNKHYEPAEYFTNDESDAHSTAKHMVKEGVQLDELSKDTLKSYHKKAVDSLTKGDVYTDKVDKRETGVTRAFKKVYDQPKQTKEGVELEEGTRRDFEASITPGKVDMATAHHRQLMNRVHDILKSSTRRVQGKGYGAQYDASEDDKYDEHKIAIDNHIHTNNSVITKHDLPSWFPKPIVHQASKLDPSTLPPILARQLAAWSRLSDSEKTKLEREFHKRGLGQPHLYMKEDIDLSDKFIVEYKKNGLLYEYKVSFADELISEGTLVTKSAAEKKVAQVIEQVTEAINSQPNEKDLIEYAKSFAKNVGLISESSYDTFKKGDSVRIQGDVRGKGGVGIIHSSAVPGGRFHIVKFRNGQQFPYHESNLIHHDEDGDDGLEDDKD